jgi:hypothetical protein
MTRLDGWLKQATRHLSRDSAARVRTEIQEHYELAREAAMSGGASADQADLSAVTALGDAKTANCQYRNVLLTSSEARILREGQWEARAVCSRPWAKWVLLAVPAAALLAAGTLFFKGNLDVARILFVGGIGMGFLFGAPFLPIYTPARARVFRALKWMVLLGILGLSFGADALRWSWLLMSTLWVVFWIESTRESIRRKLPVADWPKQLYL